MLDLIIGGYIPGTKIQLSLNLFIFTTFIMLILTAIVLTWILDRAEKRIYKQVIEAIRDQLQDEKILLN